MIRYCKQPHRSCSISANIHRKDIILEKRRLVKSHKNMHRILCVKLNIVHDNIMNNMNIDNTNYRESINSIKDLYLIAMNLDKLKRDIDKYNSEEYINNLLILGKYLNKFDDIDL